MKSARYILTLFLTMLCLCGCGLGSIHRESRQVMGVSVEVSSFDKRAGSVVFAEMERIGRLLDASDPSSEISRLNRQGWLKASAETLYLVKKAGLFWKESSGVFDVISGPGKNGFDKLQISDNIIKFSAAGVRMDLGVMAKGYAVDSAVDKLKKRGIKGALINVGGDIYCLGSKKGKPWKVAIQDPRGKNIIGCLYLSDKAVGVNAGPKSAVTVIAADSTTADVLAFSVLALGREKGLKLARKFNAQLLFN